MGARVTLKDLARSCSLGVSTVSEALRNSGNVSRETCDRVQSVAAQLGYRPHPLFASLGQQRRTRAAEGNVPIAYLTNLGPIPKRIGHYGLDPASERARTLGYEIFHVDLVAEGVPLPKVLDRLYHRGIAGILIGDWKDDAPDWDADWSRFAVVAINGYRRSSPFHGVRNSVFQHLRRIWNEAIARGYRAIGPAICKHPIPLDDDDQRLAATLLGQAEAPDGARAIPPLLVDPSERTKVIDWFHAHRPDAVIGFNDLHYYLLVQSGLRSPEDFAFCSLHCGHGDTESRITGLLDNSREIAACAVELLDQLMRHHQFGVPATARDIQIPAPWQEGNTLPQKTSTR